MSPCFISLILLYSHLLYNSTAITAQFNLQIIIVFSHYQYKVVTFFVQLKPNSDAIWNFQASGNTLFYREKITIYLNCKVCVFTEWLFLLFRFHSNYIGRYENLGSYFWKNKLSAIASYACIIRWIIVLNKMKQIIL